MLASGKGGVLCARNNKLTFPLFLGMVNVFQQFQVVCVGGPLSEMRAQLAVLRWSSVCLGGCGRVG
jgi:hypothetical protein